uniref:Cysteine proteinase 1 n=1 Tax=Lygus hesperus TaxID=30085 RepID=A0A0A9YXA6_LYGHE
MEAQVASSTTHQPTKVDRIRSWTMSMKFTVQLSRQLKIQLYKQLQRTYSRRRNQHTIVVVWQHNLNPKPPQWLVSRGWRSKKRASKYIHLYMSWCSCTVRRMGCTARTAPHCFQATRICIRRCRRRRMGWHTSSQSPQQCWLKFRCTIYCKYR